MSVMTKVAAFEDGPGRELVKLDPFSGATPGFVQRFPGRRHPRC